MLVWSSIDVEAVTETLNLTGVLGRVASSITLSRVLAIIGGMCLLGAWLRLAARKPGPLPGRTLAVWALPWLFLPFSDQSDVRAYLHTGWVAHLGMDPYTVPMGSVPGPMGPYEAQWAGGITPYPPLAILINEWGASAVGFQPYWSGLTLRCVAILAILLLAWSTRRIAPLLDLDPDTTVWLGVCNPVVLVHGIGGAHNDIVAVSIASLGIWTVLRFPRLTLAGAGILGLACAVKQSALPLLMIPVLVPDRGQPWSAPLIRRTLSRALGVAGASATSFVLVTLLSGWGLGWISGLGQTSSAASPSWFTGLVFLIGFPSTAVLFAFVTLGALVVMSAGRAWLPGAPVRFIAAVSLAMVLLAPTFREWYLFPTLLIVSLMSLEVARWRWGLWTVAYGVGMDMALAGILPWLRPLVPQDSAGLIGLSLAPVLALVGATGFSWWGTRWVGRRVEQQQLPV